MTHIGSKMVTGCSHSSEATAIDIEMRWSLKESTVPPFKLPVPQTTRLSVPSVTCAPRVVRL